MLTDMPTWVSEHMMSVHRGSLHITPAYQIWVTADKIELRFWNEEREKSCKGILPTIGNVKPHVQVCGLLGHQRLPSTIGNPLRQEYLYSTLQQYGWPILDLLI